MSNSKIDIASLGLDDLGRVVLSDDFLDKIGECTVILTAGGSNDACSNGSCAGTTNNMTCSNGYCQDSTNRPYCVPGPIG
jgi:hypothetical protein